MKLSAFSAIFFALAGLGSLVPGVAAVESTTEITFNSESEIEDTPESLAILEDAILKAAAATHDPEVWQLESDEIVSSAHSRVSEVGGRKLRPYLMSNSRINNFWAFSNYYYASTSSNCGGCRRRLGEEPTGVEDDAESHANWEATLCEILRMTDTYANVSDCVISFVDPSATKETVSGHVNITFKTSAQMIETEETLETLETALLMAADATYDPEEWFLDSDEIVSYSHSSSYSDEDGGRKLRPYLLSNKRINNFWAFSNYYYASTSSNCGGCRRRLGEGSTAIEDDAESHAKWEATLCEILSGVEGYEGVSDCVVTFVDSA